MHVHNMTTRRPAFTLIELLIALAIIAVLTALSAASYFWIVNRQYEKNTNAAIEHVYGVLKKQWNAVISEANDPIPDSVKILAAPDPSGERAKVLWKMIRLTEAFPANYSEIRTPKVYATVLPGYAGPLPLIPTDRRKYIALYNSKLGAAAGGNPQNESAACLYLALSSAKKGSPAFNADQLPVKPQDIDLDGALEFCDAWQQPIAFFRFPYAYARFDPVAPNTICPKMTGPQGFVYYNPFDPLKTLQTATWYSSANRAVFENAVQFKIGNWYTTPSLVSAGRDYVLDLTFPDMSEITTTGTKDNLYSFNIVAP